MHSLLLFDTTDRPISAGTLQRIFESVEGFKQVRRNTPAGTVIEADYLDGEDFTIVGLDSKRETISISGTSGAALTAAWMLQQHFSTPLRIVDTEYSFDLVVSDFASIEQLEAAIDDARAG
jgi:hypothetical protein